MRFLSILELVLKKKCIAWTRKLSFLQISDVLGVEGTSNKQTLEVRTSKNSKKPQSQNLENIFLFASILFQVVFFPS
jgi:prophage maintenance system killer protein